MDRADVNALVWALVGAAAFLPKKARAWICVMIGAGEPESAIEVLLQDFVRTDTDLPPATAALLSTWLAGFVGSDSEKPLNDLAARIRVCAPSGSGPSSELSMPEPGRERNASLVTVVRDIHAS